MAALRREGKEHAIWENPQTGHAEAVPRHSEIFNLSRSGRAGVSPISTFLDTLRFSLDSR